MDQLPTGAVPARIAEKLQAIPGLPRAVGRLIDQSRGKSPDPREVARIIDGDPALASRFLALVNSPYYAGRRPASTAGEAVALLGAKAAGSAVVAIAIFDALSPAGPGCLDLARHWRHSLSVAAAARHIAAKEGYGMPDDAYDAGLLHDVGRAALDVWAVEELRQVLSALSTTSGIAVEIERETIGVDHAGVGQFVLRRWGLPDTLCTAVGLHHADNLDDLRGGADGGAGVSLAGIVQAADFVAWANGFGGLDMAPKVPVTPAIEAALKGLDQRAVFGEMAGEIRRAGGFFGVSALDGEALRKSLAAAAAELARVRALGREMDQRLARQSREVGAIDILMRRVRQTYTKEGVVEVVMEAVSSGLGFDRAAFFDVDAESGGLKGAAVRDVTAIKGDISGLVFDAPGESDPLGEAVAGGKAVLLDSKGGENPLLKAMGSAEALVAPLLSSKRVVGLIYADNYLSKRRLIFSDRESLDVLAEEAGLALENALLYEHAQRMKAMAETDALTGLHNRRYLLQLLQNEIYRSQRYALALSLSMIDLDGFKMFNDKHGHQAGDRVLKVFGRLLKKTSRNIDIPGRFGGEEFIVILPETAIVAAGIYGERVRRLSEQLGARLHERYSDCNLTVSVGITQFNEKKDTLESFLHRVDQAMYAAKTRGKNRVCAL